VRKSLALVLFSAALGAGPLAEAQQARKISRIGYLSSTDPAADSPRAEGIRAALRELGYIEGQNIAIEYRYTGGKRDRPLSFWMSWCVSKLFSSWYLRREPVDPGGQECDQDDSSRGGRSGVGSCQSRFR
jgi:hypothetical protein